MKQCPRRTELSGENTVVTSTRLTSAVAPDRIVVEPVPGRGVLIGTVIGGIMASVEVASARRPRALMANIARKVGKRRKGMWGNERDGTGVRRKQTEEKREAAASRRTKLLVGDINLTRLI